MNFDDEYDLGMFRVPSFNSPFVSINSLVGYSAHLSLAYNLSDIFIQLYKRKWVYVLHHLALLPFLLGYLLAGHFYYLYFVYGLLEVSSLSFNFRQIVPAWDIPHKILYVIIRIISTPLLLTAFITEINNKWEEISSYWILTASLSNILLVIFNSVSVFLAINSFSPGVKKD
jgi:hypothetical protein